MNKKNEPEGNALMQQVGDPRAVARQQIMYETVKAELRHLDKNRTTDFFVNNPKNSKSINYTIRHFPGEFKFMSDRYYLP